MDLFAKIRMDLFAKDFGHAPNRLPVSDLIRNQIFPVKKQIIVQISHGIEDYNGILKANQPGKPSSGLHMHLYAGSACCSPGNA